MAPLLIGGIIESVGKISDDLFTSDEERLKMALAERQVDAQLLQGQMAVNTAEAGNASVFVAGWRPAVGWICACALAYQFVLYPLLVWGWSLMQAKGWIPTTLPPPPVIDSQELWVLLTGMLGIAGMRSFDKVKGVAK